MKAWMRAGLAAPPTKTACINSTFPGWLPGIGTGGANRDLPRDAEGTDPGDDGPTRQSRVGVGNGRFRS